MTTHPALGEDGRFALLQHRTAPGAPPYVFAILASDTTISLRVDMLWTQSTDVVEAHSAVEAFFFAHDAVLLNVHREDPANAYPRVVRERKSRSGRPRTPRFVAVEPAKIAARVPRDQFLAGCRVLLDMVVDLWPECAYVAPRGLNSMIFHINPDQEPVA